MKESNFDQTCWEGLAEAWSVRIPPERLRAIAPALEAFARDVRRALDHDLRQVEPAFRFEARRR